MTASSWHLLPPDLIEHQIGQIELLMAMYPEEVTLDKTSEQLLEAFKSDIENNTTSTTSASHSSAPIISLLLQLTVSSQTLPLDISIPFSHTSPNPPEPPHITVRIRQPSWLNRAATTHLNSQIPPSQDLFITIEEISSLAATHHLLTTPSPSSPTTTTPSQQPDPLVRVWFYFPSISTRSKRDDLIAHAPRHHLTGFLYAGKPGLLCLEGGSRAVDEYMRFIKTESWGDIPAHHKKVSERHRESGAALRRVFGAMSEITDSVGERRGQRANRGDMKAVEQWLVERGLGDAFAKVLM